MNSIDTFAGIPLLIASFIGIILLLFLLLIKIRNTGKINFIFYPATLVFVGGLIFTYYNRQLFVMVLITILTELLLLAYVIVIALLEPMKRVYNASGIQGAAAVSGEELSAIDEAERRFKSTLAINRDFTAKASDFFRAEDVTAAFVEYLDKLMRENTKADGCAILVLDDYENVLSVKSVTGDFPPPYKLPDDLPHKPLRVSTNFKFAQFAQEGNIFGDMLTGGRAVNITVPMKDSRIYQNGPEDFLRVGPCAFIPIARNGLPAVLVCLTKQFATSPFSTEEFEAAKVIADAASVVLSPVSSFISYAEHAEMSKEGDIAVKFQKSLLPEKMPVLGGLSIGKYTSAVENVCGDYYDIIPSRKDRIMFVVADVAGKGMNSLVMMIMIKAMLRLVANTNQSMATLLEWINQAVCSEKNGIDRFASIALINYNSLDKTAQIATCGINPVVLYSAKDKSIKKISMDTEPIGVEKTAKYSNIDLSLDVGDVLVSCTDGVTECLNNDGIQYSLDNLLNTLKANANLDGKGIAGKLKDNVKKFRGDAQQYDDQTFLVVKIQG